MITAGNELVVQSGQMPKERRDGKVSGTGTNSSSPVGHRVTISPTGPIDTPDYTTAIRRHRRTYKRLFVLGRLLRMIVNFNRTTVVRPGRHLMTSRLAYTRRRDGSLLLSLSLSLSHTHTHTISPYILHHHRVSLDRLPRRRE